MAYAEISILLARVVCLYDMRLREGSTLGEGSPALGKGRTRRTECQLYDELVSMTDGPLLESKMRKM